MNHIAAFEPDFAYDVYRKNRWKGFLKTKKDTTPRKYDETSYGLKKMR